MSKNRAVSIVSLVLLCLAALSYAQSDAPFRFVILGDRTGEAQPGIYETILAQAAAENPDFILTAGDSIQGQQDSTAESQWRQWEHIAEPFRQFRLYLTPGNHDVWSEGSARLYEAYSQHPLHYSFDSGPVHVTVLDNSRTDDLPLAELQFLEDDLKTHAAQPVKFVISHRPSWELHALTRDPDFPLHQLARKYGVQYVIAGHLHQMLHYTLDGIQYVSLPSAGGHLRDSGKYRDGWFFGFASVETVGNQIGFQIHERDGHVTPLSAWGPAGLR